MDCADAARAALASLGCLRQHVAVTHIRARSRPLRTGPRLAFKEVSDPRLRRHRPRHSTAKSVLPSHPQAIAGRARAVPTTA